MVGRKAVPSKKITWQIVPKLVEWYKLLCGGYFILACSKKDQQWLHCYKANVGHSVKKDWEALLKLALCNTLCAVCNNNAVALESTVNF